MSITATPFVAGYRLSRPEAADAAEWSEFQALPLFKQHTSSTIESAADLLPLIERSLSSDPAAPVHFIAREAGTRRLVASVGFHSISAVNRTAEVTYGVHPGLWGRGLATSLCIAAVQWGFEARRWVRIQATLLEENLASRRVLQKAGFGFEGTLRNFRIVRGEPRDYLLYAIIPAVEPTAPGTALPQPTAP